jgi:hypothetical protein
VAISARPISSVAYFFCALVSSQRRRPRWKGSAVLCNRRFPFSPWKAIDAADSSAVSDSFGTVLTARRKRIHRSVPGPAATKAPSSALAGDARLAGRRRSSVCVRPRPRRSRPFRLPSPGRHRESEAAVGRNRNTVYCFHSSEQRIVALSLSKGPPSRAIVGREVAEAFC